MSSINKITGAIGIELFPGVEGGIDPETGQPIAKSGLATTRAEAIKEGKDAGEKLSKFDIPSFIYNDGDTVTNNNIDADPDDKAALSRAVKRAIEQANSFERQRLGR